MAQLKIDYKLSQGTGLTGEPVRQNNWELYIPELGGDSYLHVVTASLPNYTISPIEINHFNEKVKIAGANDLANIAVSVYDTLDPETIDTLYNWHKKVYNPETGQVGFASEYKKEGTLVQFDSKGNAIRNWRLIGLWPSGVTYGDLSYTAFETIEVAIDFVVDRAILS